MKRPQKRGGRLALVLGLAAAAPLLAAGGVVGWHVWELNSGPAVTPPAILMAEFAGPGAGVSQSPARAPKPAPGTQK